MQADRIMAARGWYLLPAAAILFYLWRVCLLADDTPKLDDLNDVFGFFRQLALAQTPLQTALAFFYPNNEHITLVDHLVYYAQYQLLGEIRFYPLILLGHGIVIATGLLLASVARGERRPFVFACIALAYVNLHYWDSTFKAMTAISNQAVILFAVAALFALLRWQRFGLAVLCALLATFTQGNGMLVWPVGLLVLLLEPHWRKQHAALWLLSAATVLALFWWAHHVFSPPSPVTAAAVLERLQQHPLQPLRALLAFLGSLAFPASDPLPAMVTGLAALLALGWHAAQPLRNWLLLSIVLFLLLSAITASGLRGLILEDAGGVMESRYRMYSVAFLLLALVALLDQLARQRATLALALLATALAVHVSGYRHEAAIRQQAQLFRDSYQHWLVDGDFRRQATYFPPISDHFLFVAHHLGLFDAMQLAPDSAILTPLPAATDQTCDPLPAPAGLCPMTMRHRGNAIAVAIEAAVDTDIQPALPATITLCDAQARAVMTFAIPDTAPPPTRWLVREADIPAGTYRVLFQSAQQAVCETQLTKKPRKVETEMRTLFGR